MAKRRKEPGEANRSPRAIFGPGALSRVMAPTTGLPFSPPVIIEHGPRVGEHRIVGSVRTAAECLVAGWPIEGRGEAYRAALQACYEALAGGIDVEEARQAFILAAQEVEVFVKEGDGVSLKDVLGVHAPGSYLRG
jgi:hypothetical protein